ncbi:MAG: hypothetical protein L0287_15350 [Anaerolineae bacterium]|nr:hypothetical protein [Anaerolineae bacterium]
MALSQVYTAVPNDVITAARWNNEFGNILNNGTDVAFPLTKAVSFAGFTITLDSAGATSIISSSSQAISFTPGAKSGTPNTTGKTLDVVAHTFTDSATAGSGTATSCAFVALQRPTLAATNSSVTTTDAATLYIANSPAAGTNETITNAWALWVDAGNVRFDGNLRVDGTSTFSDTSTFTGAVTFSATPVGSVLLHGHISGLIWAQNGVDAVNDVDITSGSAIDLSKSDADRRLMVLTTTLTKQIDAAWAVGTNQGMLDSGAIGDNPYFLWLIYRSDTGVTDVLASLSSTAPTMPTSYDHKRLIGYLTRGGGSNQDWTTYDAGGGAIDFQFDVPTLDVNLAATLTTSRRTDAIRVPLSFSVVAHINVIVSDATAPQIAWISCPDTNDAAPSQTAAPLENVVSTSTGAFYVGESLHIRTSSTGTIAARSSLATCDLYAVSTLGFRWARRN